MGHSSSVLCAALRPKSLQNNKGLIIRKERDGFSGGHEPVMVGKVVQKQSSQEKRSVFLRRDLELPARVDSRKQSGFSPVLFLF